LRRQGLFDFAESDVTSNPECFYNFVGTARPICGEPFRVGALLARFAESHSGLGDCSPDLWRAIPDWGTARPICGEPFRVGELLARFAESHSGLGDCPPDLRRAIPGWGTARPICGEPFRVWGIARPICGEPFRVGALPARYDFSDSKLYACIVLQIHILSGSFGMTTRVRDSSGYPGNIRGAKRKGC